MAKNIYSRIAGGLLHVFLFAAIAVGVHFLAAIIFGDYDISLGYRIAYGVMMIVAFVIGATGKTEIRFGSGSKGDADDSDKNE